MTLPVRPLPASSVEVNGTPVSFRSLSRAEALKLTQDFKDDVDAAEVFVLVCATGVTDEEARTWRAETTTDEAGKLIDGILIFSGLATEAEAPDPKPSTNGASSLEVLTLTSSS